MNLSLTYWKNSTLTPLILCKKIYLFYVWPFVITLFLCEALGRDNWFLPNQSECSLFSAFILLWNYNCAWQTSNLHSHLLVQKFLSVHFLFGLCALIQTVFMTSLILRLCSCHPTLNSQLHTAQLYPHLSNLHKSWWCVTRL